MSMIQLHIKIRENNLNGNLGDMDLGSRKFRKKRKTGILALSDLRSNPLSDFTP